MPSLSVVKQLIIELVSSKDAHRVIEPRLIMDDPGQVAAFRQAGSTGGVMAPLYLFHCVHVCEIIQPGDTVLDLGCGPANQMSMIAGLNPDANFVGLDLSEEMLDQAKEMVRETDLGNVTLRHGDITNLEGINDASVDAVYSTVVLHHLADTAQLEKTLYHANRVLKPGGGIYIADFGHLRTERAIKFCAHQYADRQPPAFTEDYYHSLRAAFELKDWRRAYKKYLAHRAKLASTFAVPFMVAIKSEPRRSFPVDLLDALSRHFKLLPAYHQTDFKDIAILFRLGGLRTPQLRT